MALPTLVAHQLGVRQMALPECGFAPSGVRSFPIRLHSALLPAARTLVTLSRQRVRLLCVWFGQFHACQRCGTERTDAEPTRTTSPRMV